MGWASWNHYFCDYDEKTIREQADALVSTGMRDAGYKYLIIQECIAPRRDTKGNLVVDSARFPSGIRELAAYIHKLGLKAGIYTDIGRNTCYPDPKFQGSYGHEQQDADTFAAWGIDLVEMDYCNRVETHSGRWVYERMAEAIKKTGRPMIFSLCSWGNEQPWEWAQGKAQMWRTDLDISFEKNHVEWDRVVRNFESGSAHSVFSGPESWNDADMLEIGNPGLNDTEAQAQMSMWAISPRRCWLVQT
jgi:alpha-galactosidase